MKASEMREMGASALVEELEKLLKSQFSLRMQLATQQVSNTAQLKNIRKDIARVKTVMSEQKRSL